MRTRDFLEWPFFAPVHRELAERVDAWAGQRFAGGGGHAEDRASVDAACRQLVRDLGSAGWTRYSVPSEAAGLDMRNKAMFVVAQVVVPAVKVLGKV